MPGNQYPRRPRYGKWMPNAKEHCARLKGHDWSCRTRYALDNAYRAETGRERPKEYVDV